ncbi:MAG: xylulose kinase [Gemmataceae bacterium]|nr:xylulose kinase [Gemmataceae bacterium]
MAEPLRCVDPDALLTGWDFSTGAAKCLAFDLSGKTLAEARLPTDLWTADGVSELSVTFLEGQARAVTRSLAAKLDALGLLSKWVAGGISATHHTSGRIDKDRAQVRRAICWNDMTLARFHQEGLARLGGQDRARELTGGPWAIRYSLSHLVKDEATLSRKDWERTWRILPHGSLAAGFLTGNFDHASLSSAASTGMMDLRSGRWRPEMLDALASEDYRRLALSQLPPILDASTPVGTLLPDLAQASPLVFPTLDDQAAGLIGGGAVDAGQVALILGNSAVVNSSGAAQPSSGSLDVMRLNSGPYLWMRCYNNGAQFLDPVLGPNPDWKTLELAGEKAAPCACPVMPFLHPEPSVGVHQSSLAWTEGQPPDIGQRYRSSLEALAYLMARGVREHEAAGQRITRLTMSGGIARSPLMGRILASVLERPLERLESDEGPALGAAASALAALETHRRKARGIGDPYTVADAVAQMVRFRERAEPVAEWVPAYRAGYAAFLARVG